MSLYPDRWRQYADTLRELANGCRARAAEGPSHWVERELREAARLERESDYAMAWAARDEKLLMEDQEESHEFAD